MKALHNKKSDNVNCFCGREITGNGKYCSAKCRQKAYRERKRTPTTTATCIHCGDTFNKKSEGEKYCTLAKCRKAKYRADKLESRKNRYNPRWNVATTSNNDTYDTGEHCPKCSGLVVVYLDGMFMIAECVNCKRHRTKRVSGDLLYSLFGRESWTQDNE